MNMVMLFAYKDESFEVFFKFFEMVQNEKGVCITAIINDHGGEFENENFHLQNGEVERKNRSLQEMTITILNDNFYT